MKKGVVFGIIAMLVLAVGCSKGAQTAPVSTGGEAVVATVNGTAISSAELDEAAKSQLQRIATQIYQIKKQGLDDLINRKLVEAAAAKKGVLVDDYMKEEVDSKIEEPTEDEVKKLYDARKGKNTLPFEKVKEQIIAYIKQTKTVKAEQDLYAKLKNEADVKILIEPPRASIDVGDAPAIGPKNAKVTMVEFSDYQCPFCKRSRPTVWKLTEDYKDKIRYVFADFPLSFHQYSRKAHEAARCAGDQGKYFDYNKKLFNDQDKLSVDDLKKYAGDLKLNASKFNKCLDSGEHAKDVEENMQAGVNAGVSGTPSFFINGIQISGAQSIQAFKDVIDEELKR